MLLLFFLVIKNSIDLNNYKYYNKKFLKNKSDNERDFLNLKVKCDSNKNSKIKDYYYISSPENILKSKNKPFDETYIKRKNELKKIKIFKSKIVKNIYNKDLKERNIYNKKYNENRTSRSFLTTFKNLQEKNQKPKIKFSGLLEKYKKVEMQYEKEGLEHPNIDFKYYKYRKNLIEDLLKDPVNLANKLDYDDKEIQLYKKKINEVNNYLYKYVDSLKKVFGLNSDDKIERLIYKIEEINDLKNNDFKKKYFKKLRLKSFGEKNYNYLNVHLNELNFSYLNFNENFEIEKLYDEKIKKIIEYANEINFLSNKKFDENLYNKISEYLLELLKMYYNNIDFFLKIYII